MALAMDLVETQQASQPEEVFPETAVAESLGELQTCSKCQQSLPVKLLVHKSKNSYLCKPCNRLSAFVSKLDVPEGFISLSGDQLVDFYRDVKKYTDETIHQELRRTGKPSPSLRFRSLLGTWLQVQGFRPPAAPATAWLLA